MNTVHFGSPSSLALSTRSAFCYICLPRHLPFVWEGGRYIYPRSPGGFPGGHTRTLPFPHRGKVGLVGVSVQGAPPPRTHILSTGFTRHCVLGRLAILHQRSVRFLYHARYHFLMCSIDSTCGPLLAHKAEQESITNVEYNILEYRVVVTKHKTTLFACFYQGTLVHELEEQANCMTSSLIRCILQIRSNIV